MQYKRGLIIIVIVLIALILYFLPKYTGKVVIYQQGINRVLPYSVKTGDTVQINIVVNQDAKIVALREQPPVGWEVSDISHGGVLRSDGSIGWLFYPLDYLEKPLILTYKVKANNDDVNFFGTYFLDDQTASTSGNLKTAIGEKTVYREGFEFKREQGEEKEEDEEITITVEELEEKGNLIASYDFDSDARDSVGEHHGTFIGDAKVAVGRLVLDGYGDYVEVDYSEDFNLSKYTISVWAKLASNPKSIGDGVFGTRSGEMGYTFDFKIRPTNIHGDLGTGKTWITTGADCSGGLIVGTWHHIVYSVDENKYSIYIDGMKCSEKNINMASLLMKSTQTIRIGHTGYSTEWFNGLLDEVKIYNVALTESQVKSIFNSKKDSFGIKAPELIAHYKFESNANDYSGNERHGTLVGDAKIENGRLVLDGSGDYVEIGDLGLSVNSPVTITAWYLFNQTAKQRGLWVMMNSIIYHHSNNNYIYLSALDDNNDFFGFPVDNTGVWYYIAIGCAEDTSTCRLIDVRVQQARTGTTLTSSKSVTVQPTSSDSGDLSYADFRIGDKKNVGAANSEFKGQIGSFRIYNGILSYTETTNIFNIEKDKYFSSCTDPEQSIFTPGCVTVKDSFGVSTQYCDTCIRPRQLGETYSLTEYSCVPVGQIGGGQVSSKTVTCDYGCVSDATGGACVVGGSCSGLSCSELDIESCENERCHIECMGSFPADYCSQYSGISVENYNNCLSKAPICEWYGPTPSDMPWWEDPENPHDCYIMGDCISFSYYYDFACDDPIFEGYCSSFCVDNYYPALECTNAETKADCESWGCTWTES